MPGLDRVSLEGVCTRFAVRRLSLFDRSAIPGMPKQDAVLVEFDASEPSDLAPLRQALGMEVVTEEGLPPHARSRVLAEARLQYSRPLDRTMARMRAAAPRFWASPLLPRLAAATVAMGAGGLVFLFTAPGAMHRRNLMAVCLLLLVLGPLALVALLTRERPMWDAEPRVHARAFFFLGVVPVCLCVLALIVARQGGLPALERILAAHHH
jgi:hypothetical protein